MLVTEPDLEKTRKSDIGWYTSYQNILELVCKYIQIANSLKLMSGFYIKRAYRFNKN